MARILVVDDEANIRSSLKSALERRSHSVVTAETMARGREYASGGFDVIFLDIMLPDGSGIDLLKELLLKNPRQLIVMISGHADVDMAVEAIKAGAYDFIEKPISLDRVLITIDNATKTGSLIEDRNRLTTALYGDFVGESSAIRQLREDVRRSAPKTTRFLITGENGTGKELVANMIHRESRYSNGSFVAVNCAALPSELVEAELFGHTPGAFTGASRGRKGKFLEADQGSIFLDEISEMPPEAQAKILRAIETKTIMPVGSEKPVEIECNIIAASNRDLQAMVAKAEFREDLLYRLNVVRFHIPPLRERSEDIVPLARHFLFRFASETKSTVKTLSADAQALIQTMRFPGNVRELKNLIERLNIYCESDIIESTDLKSASPTSREVKTGDLKEAVASFERQYIESAIRRNGGNIAETARSLGLERSHLYKKMKKLGIRESQP